MLKYELILKERETCSPLKLARNYLDGVRFWLLEETNKLQGISISSLKDDCIKKVTLTINFLKEECT